MTDTVRILSIQADRLAPTSAFTLWNREVPMDLLLDRTRSLRERLQSCYSEHHLSSLSPSEPVDWPSYILGVLVYLLDRIHRASMPRGFNVVIISDVPCNKGLASSAALEVAVAGAGNFHSPLRRYP